MKIRQIITTLLLLVLPLSAQAWGMLGHYIAGDITDHYLTPVAKAKVATLLSAATVAEVSTWGDFVRSNAAFKDKDTWHYTNFDSGLSKEDFMEKAVLQHSGENVYRVGWLIEGLKRNPNDTVALKLLIHFAQDLHCPMHLAHSDDQGGNSVQIRWFGQNTSLHSLWDSKLIDAQNMSYSEYGSFLIRTVTPHITLAYEKGAEIEWAWQTYQVTEQIYRDRSKIARPYEYMYQYKAIWEKSLAMAGVHLAIVLNTLYGE